MNADIRAVANDVVTERIRQVAMEGWSAEHDDQHQDGELAMAAACYATPRLLVERQDRANRVEFSDPFPWEERFDKRPVNGNVVYPNSTLPAPQRRRQLVQACALLLAEIERLDRAERRAATTASEHRCG